MKKGERREVKMGLLVMVLAALFLLTSPMLVGTQIWGQDYDGDGFMNQDEESGITLMCKEPNDISYNKVIRFEPCKFGPGFTTKERKECVDPDSKDVFVIMKQVTSKLIPRPGDPDFDPDFDLYEFIRNPPQSSGYQGDSGLGINVIDVLASHPNLEDCSQRVIYQYPDYIQGAVLIEERDFHPNGYFGDSDWTSPDGFGKGKVFTQAIYNYVEDKCDKAMVCIDHNTGTSDRNGIIMRYFKHIMCHEIAHLLKLRHFWDRRFGAHYGSSRKTILEEQVTMTAKGPAGKTSVEFFITDDFTGEDFDFATLTEY